MDKSPEQSCNSKNCENNGNYTYNTVDDIANIITENSSDSTNFAAYLRLFLRRIVSIRSLAYTSEGAEAMRPIVHKAIVRLGYGLSFGYVGADIGLKLYDIKDQPSQIIKYKALDLSAWHLSASLVVPAVTIHTFVSGITKLQKKFIYTATKLPTRFGKVFPTICGLISIPFIIKPIDYGTDFVMDKYVRPYYPVQIPHETHH